METMAPASTFTFPSLALAAALPLTDTRKALKAIWLLCRFTASGCPVVKSQIFITRTKTDSSGRRRTPPIGPVAVAVAIPTPPPATWTHASRAPPATLALMSSPTAARVLTDCATFVPPVPLATATMLVRAAMFHVRSTLLRAATATVYVTGVTWGALPGTPRLRAILAVAPMRLVPRTPVAILASVTLGLAGL